MAFVNHTWSLAEQIQAVLQDGIGSSANIVHKDKPPDSDESKALLGGGQDAIAIIPIRSERSPDDPVGDVTRVFLFELYGYSVSNQDSRYTISELTEKAVYFLQQKKVNNPHWLEISIVYEYIEPDEDEDGSSDGVARSKINLRMSRNVC